MDRPVAAITALFIERTRDFPPKALEMLLESLLRIEKKYGLEKAPAKEDLLAIERGAGHAIEHVKKAHPLSSFDSDAAGKADFIEVVSRVQKLSGEDQGEIAEVVFALLDTYRSDSAASQN